jgi:hypothetical protein
LTVSLLQCFDNAIDKFYIEPLQNIITRAEVWPSTPRVSFQHQRWSEVLASYTQQFAHYAQDHAAAGLGAGVAGVLCMHPLDLLRVKFHMATKIGRFHLPLHHVLGCSNGIHENYVSKVL